MCVSCMLANAYSATGANAIKLNSLAKEGGAEGGTLGLTKIDFIAFYDIQFNLHW
jgi:hypothetical protein